MKLLILTNNPNRASYRQRIGNYLSVFSRHGIAAEVFQFPANKLRRWSLLKSSRHYDAVFLHKKCLNFFDAEMLRRYSRKIIYDFDDAIMYSPQKPASDRTSHFRLFRRTCRMADCVIAGNDYLAEQARRFCDAVHVLPTGLDVHSYADRANKTSDETIRLAWIGSQSTLRYLEELKPVLEQIGNTNKQVSLRIIADAFFDMESVPIEKKQWALESQIADLTACDIGLAPLPDNRFTRGKCGFKILQYFAAGLPVIASPVGVNRDLIEQSHAGFQAETPDQWLEKLSLLIDNPSLRTEMGQNGRAYAAEYDISVIGKRLCDLILQTTA